MLLQSLKTKNCIDVTNTRWHFLWTMFSACTSIKVAVLLNKVADWPKEHSALSTPSFTFSFFSSGFHAAAVGTCSHCRLVPACSHCENRMEVPQKTKNGIVIWSSIPTPGHIPDRSKIWKDSCTPVFISSTIYNSQDMKTTWMSTRRYMDKENVYAQWNIVYMCVLSHLVVSDSLQPHGL